MAAWNEDNPLHKGVRFSLYLDTGDWGNRKLIVRSTVPIEDTGGWRRESSGGGWISFHETLPSRSFLASLLDASSEDDRKSVKIIFEHLKTLPRILFDESDKGYFVKVSWKDVFSRETVYALGSRWDPDKKAWHLKGRKDLLLPVLNNLAFGMSRREKMALDASDLNEKLRQSQKEGVYFLSSLWNDFSHGGILAHGMRMGKTLTSLTFFREGVSRGIFSRAVVVAPLSTLNNWKNEWDTWYSYNGYASIFSAEHPELDVTAPVIITNYGYLLNESRLSAFLAAARGSMVILDEATECKNVETNTFSAAMKLSAAGLFTAVLTGTPMENNVGEMAALLRLADPSAYPWKEFSERHVTRTSRKIFHRESGKWFNRPEVKYKGEKEFRERTLRFFHRRNDPNIGKHIEDVVFVPLNEFEKKLCRDIESAYCRLLGEKLSEEDFLKIYVINHKKRGREMDVVSLQSQAVNAPASIISSESESEVLSEIRKQYSDTDLLGAASSKISRLRQILETHPGFVVVFFEHSRIAHAAAQSMPMPVQVVCGTLSAKKRKEAERMCAEKEMPLFCTDVFSMGMDFSDAKALVHYELPWNPSKLDQRSRRLDKIDKDETKYVYYLISEHPVEKNDRLKKLKQKAKTINKVVDGGEADLADLYYVRN